MRSFSVASACSVGGVNWSSESHRPMDIKRWRQFDLVMLLAALALVAYGVAVIHSATCSPDCSRLVPPSSWAMRQLAYTAVGVILLAGLTLIDYRVYRV